MSEMVIVSCIHKTDRGSWVKTLQLPAFSVLALLSSKPFGKLRDERLSLQVRSYQYDTSTAQHLLYVEVPYARDAVWEEKGWQWEPGVYL